MSARLAVAPIHVVDCDDCGLTFIPASPFNQRSHGRARVEAQAAGWKVRPPRGPGAKTAPDKCPACRTDLGSDQ